MGNCGQDSGQSWRCLGVMVVNNITGICRFLTSVAKCDRWPTNNSGHLQIFYCIYFCVTHFLTYSMVQSPSWEATRFSASREFPRILWSPKVHYRIHNSQPPAPILRSIQSVPHPTSWRSILILSGSFKWSVTLRFPHRKPIYTSPLPYVLHAPPISFFSILAPEYPYLRISHGVSESFPCLCWTYDGGGTSGRHSECTVFTVTPSTGSDFHWHVTENTYDTG
jgi:hypothetical protein